MYSVSKHDSSLRLDARGRRDALEHLTSDLGDALERGDAGLSGSLLESGLDGVDGSVGHGAHGAGNETDEGSLVRGEVSGLVLGLPLLEPILEVGVGGEVDGLVGALAEGGQGDTTVQGTETFLLNDGEESVAGVAVLGNVERVGHGVVLSLETNLDDLHGGDNSDGLSHTSGETSEEEGLAGNDTGLLVGKKLLVPLERSETDGHLGHDTGENGTETLVQTKGSLLLDDLNTGLDEATLGHTGLPAAARKLHADLDGIWTAPSALAALKQRIVSNNLPRGWHTRASIIPAPPPATFREKHCQRLNSRLYAPGS